MIQHEGFYFYCESRLQRSIWIRKSKTIASIGEDPGTRVWTAPIFGGNSDSIWAPELHFINGKWFIYYAADNGKNKHHRMWVLESESADPLGPYHCRGQLQTDGWAIDGTMLTLNHGEMFFIWSGWPGRRNGQQNLYIAPMQDPVTVSSSRILIAKPEEPWERVAMPICEGPQVLRRHGKTFIIYSASGSWTPDYCLGLLVNKTNDVLNPKAWEKRGPVFQKTDHVWGLGHCSFVKSPCRTEDWIIYHSKSKLAHGWEDRDVHAKRFFWTIDGLPDFGMPGPRGASPTAPKFPLSVEQVDVGLPLFHQIPAVPLTVPANISTLVSPHA